MKPLHWISEHVFGCHHKKLSRVFTINQRTYQVCFECGQEFEYSWRRMLSLRSGDLDNAAPALKGTPAAEVSLV